MNVLLQQLRPAPLETVGLLEALKDQCQALEYRSGAEVTFEADELPPAERLPASAQETLFRIAQEALSNVARHARAQKVIVSLHTRFQLGREWLLLAVQDDGQGFIVPKEFPIAPGNSSEGGMGLGNIAERAKDLEAVVDLKSKPGQGTTLQVWLPLLDLRPVALEDNSAELKKAAIKLRGTLILTSGIVGAFMLVGCGVLFGSLLANYREMQTQPRTVIQQALLWLPPVLLLLPANQYFITRTTRKLQFQAVTPIEEVRQLGMFRETAGFVLAIILFVIVPILPFIYFDKPLSTILQIILAILLIVATVYYAWRVQQQYFLKLKLLSPEERSETLEKYRKGIKFAPILLILNGFQIYLQLSFQPDIGEFAAISNWSHQAMIYLVSLTSGLSLLSYWFVLEQYRGQPFSLRTRLVALGGLAAIGLIVVLFIILTGSKFEEIHSFQSAGDEFSGKQIEASPDGQHIAVLSYSGEVILLDNRAKLVTRLPGLPKVESSEAAIAWSKETDQILLAEKAAVIKRWDSAGTALPDLVLEGAPNLTGVRFTPEGRFLIARFGNLQETGLWNTTDGHLIGRYNYWSGALSPDGTRVAREVTGGGISIISLETGKQIAHSLEGQYDDLAGLVWSPDGKMLAASYNFNGNSSGTNPDGQNLVRLWNADGTLRATLEGDTRSISEVSWSPDSRFLVSAASDGLRLWNSDGQKIGAFNKKYLTISNLVWLGDGNRLAARGYNPLVSIWQING